MSRVKTDNEIELLYAFETFLSTQPGGTKRLSEPMNIQHAAMFESFKAGMRFQFALNATGRTLVVGNLNE